MIFFRSVRGCLAGALVATFLFPLVAPAQTTRKRPAPPTAATATVASPTPFASPYVLPDVVASVNGDPIRATDLEHAAQALLANQGKSLADLPAAAKPQVYSAVLESLIDDHLISSAAANETVDDLSVEKRYAALVSQFPDPAAFDAQVKKAGTTPEKIKAGVRLQLAQQQWLEKQLAPQTAVAPQEVEKFYKEGAPGKFDQPEMVHAQQILVPVRKDAAPEIALAAEDKAKALAERVKKGEDLATVAKDAADPGTPATNVDLGYFSQDRIMPEVGTAAFKLKVGDVSAPVRSQFGYHILKVLDKKPAHTDTLDEARPAITKFLTTEKRQKAENDLLVSLRTKAKIETFLPAA